MIKGGAFSADRGKEGGRISMTYHEQVLQKEGANFHISPQDEKKEEKKNKKKKKRS